VVKPQFLTNNDTNINVTAGAVTVVIRGSYMNRIIFLKHQNKHNGQHIIKTASFGAAPDVDVLKSPANNDLYILHNALRIFVFVVISKYLHCNGNHIAIHVNITGVRHVGCVKSPVRRVRSTVKHASFGCAVDVGNRRSLASKKLHIVPNALSGDAEIAMPRSIYQIGKIMLEIVSFGLVLVVASPRSLVNNEIHIFPDALSGNVEPAKSLCVSNVLSMWHYALHVSA
jgi:hypothetical protein